MKVAGWMKVKGAIRLECARVLHKDLHALLLMYGNETLIWRDNERSRIRAYRWITLGVFIDI